MDMLLIKKGNRYEEFPSDNKLSNGQLPNDNTAFSWHTNENGEQCLLIRGTKRTYRRIDGVTIASQQADISISSFPFRMILREKELFIEKIQNDSHPAIMLPVFHNSIEQELSENTTIPVVDGDILLLGTMKIVLFSKELVIFSDWNTTTVSLMEESPKEKAFEGFPRYKRSPRIIKKIPDGAITIENPPDKMQMDKGSLVQIIVTPLIMLSITVAMSIMMKRGLFVLMSVATSIVSITASVTKFVKDRKENRQKNETRQSVYQQYLLDTRKKIYQAKQEEEETYTYNNPRIQDIEHFLLYIRQNWGHQFIIMVKNMV